MKAAKTDANHTLIAEAARWAGVSVAHTHRLGQGFPDQVWGVEGFNLLVEVKTDGGTLTKPEQLFHTQWGGQIAVIRTPEQAIAEIERWRSLGEALKEML